MSHQVGVRGVLQIDTESDFAPVLSVRRLSNSLRVANTKAVTAYHVPVDLFVGPSLIKVSQQCL